MIHIRINPKSNNHLDQLADCQGCNPGGPFPLSTPISELSAQPGQSGWENFKRIASSWGYD